MAEGTSVIPTPCAQCGAPPGDPAGWSKVVLVSASYAADARVVPFVALGDADVYYFDKDACRTTWLGRLAPG